ncbi:Gfo/Idh/MocA family oxidoreductase [Bosea vestrisii]|uniref:Gfo/Idh/MocA family protein n=1 Tax=Bosea vestrisii TaxID=151416 RepID=UPI0024DF3886|nr:Gfo/Idh/MocA family oxidoreductase [Bosea vestrisii]WID98867.1 Gfo/Idh/MocA family oxidoreductase [Bosea vestrisii]
MRIAIIGCGMIGRIHADRLAGLGHAIVAASDPDLERARAVAAGGRAYQDHRDLLREGGIDVACVCSPTPHHHGAVMDCAAAGVHVFLEKPMSVTLDEGREMAAAMEAAGLALGFGFKMRFEAVFAEARRLVAEGTIGRPRYATFSFYQPTPPGERIWYADIGVLRDMLVHMIDLAGWLLDAGPSAVRARTDREIGRAGEDKAFIDIDFGERVEARIQGGYLADYPDVAGREDIVFQIVGERGYVLGKRPDLLLAVTADGSRTHALAPIDAFAAELKAFTDALAARELPPVTGRDGLRAQAMIDAAERSAAAGGAEARIPRWH